VNIVCKLFYKDKAMEACLVVRALAWHHKVKGQISVQVIGNARKSIQLLLLCHSRK